MAAGVMPRSRMAAPSWNKQSFAFTLPISMVHWYVMLTMCVYSPCSVALCPVFLEPHPRGTQEERSSQYLLAETDSPLLAFSPSQSAVSHSVVGTQLQKKKTTFVTNYKHLTLSKCNLNLTLFFVSAVLYSNKIPFRNVSMKLYCRHSIPATRSFFLYLTIYRAKTIIDLSAARVHDLAHLILNMLEK